MAGIEMELFSTGVLGNDIPMSNAVKAGDFVFVGGNIGNVHGKLELVEGGIAAETQQALHHMREALEAAGSSIDRVIKCNIYLVDMAEFGELNDVYGKFFGSHRPTRATVAVKELGLGGRVEIECVALA
ncbi:MAG: RidA family protein [Gemmatimonadetes bacterium]|nr:RidA family protein [Gemmatimonadota bacterium]